MLSGIHSNVTIQASIFLCTRIRPLTPSLRKCAVQSIREHVLRIFKKLKISSLQSIRLRLYTPQISPTRCRTILRVYFSRKSSLRPIASQRWRRGTERLMPSGRSSRTNRSYLFSYGCIYYQFYKPELNQSYESITCTSTGTNADIDTHSETGA